MGEWATEAKRRHDLHVDHPTHRPLSEGYEEVGLVGEDVLSQAFGGKVDLVVRPGGDGGVDKVIYLDTGSGVKGFTVDVKTARKPIHLIVEQGKVKADIYFLAGYSDETGAARLLAWQWGSKLLRKTPRDFGYGVMNHAIHIADLREVEEIRGRLVNVEDAQSTEVR